MRFDRRIRLIYSTPGKFNPKTGNYENEQLTHQDLYASIMDTRAQMISLVYGKLVEGSLTVTLQNHVSFDPVRKLSRIYQKQLRRYSRTRKDPSYTIVHCPASEVIQTSSLFDNIKKVWNFPDLIYLTRSKERFA